MFAGEPTILPVFELDGKPAEEESYNLTSSDLSLCGGNEVFSEFLYFHLREHLSCCQLSVEEKSLLVIVMIREKRFC